MEPATTKRKSELASMQTKKFAKTGETCKSGTKAKKIEKSEYVIDIETRDGSRATVLRKLEIVYSLTESQATALFELARSLEPDDPAIFITFRNGREVRAGLRRGGIAVQNDRPCDQGANAGASLQNIKDWVSGLVDTDGTSATVHPVDDNALAIGNLTQNQYDEVMMILSFTPNPFPNSWAAAVLASNQPLGSLIGITGIGVGSATVTRLPSIVFFG